MAEKYGEIPKDFKGRMAYFWDYYKWHTIAVAGILIVLAVTITQCANRPNPDYSVILSISKQIYSETEYTEVIGKYLGKYGKDLNGDGKVLVSVMDLSMGGAQESAMRTKLMAEIQIGEAIIFITDEDQFEYFESEIELFQTHDFLTDKNNKAFNWNGTKMQKKIDKEDFFTEDIYISLRKVAGSSAEKKDSAQSREKNAVQLLKKLIKDNPAENITNTEE